MSKNIIIQEFNSNNEPRPRYPHTSATNVMRQAYDVSYIEGDTLLEIAQYLGNTYCAPRGDVWYDIENITLNDTSVICSYNNFVAVLTIYNSGSIHYLIVNYSYDGGETWSQSTYTNSNINYRINYIIEAQASIGNSGDMEVVFIGKKETDSTLLTTYKISFNSYTGNVKYDLFRNQINLSTGGIQ